ncbi:uncharacterized protein HMPREF1541_03039 [Cyphellophora europaea CBS 101466]|uniref:Cns1/TTC4 wheel domain-containing protein n=1 Tax=Cyphellophora europaea (strain CBS 101466) TaxID=1220924 RepID=W2RZJ2_CYPE1|nr:uncharacterized protein HMPREF1541_03039 [Cyphellophora europaea CBS 101466]ETN41104.1 hypothetical protein HMPREF1541_03039 [Cyphellophora europaea CBS 101466]
MSSSRVEELPDDFDESLVLNEGPTQGLAAPAKSKNVSLAEMYEKRLDMPSAAITDKSFEEIMFDMSKTPIFMDAQDVANQTEENELLEAIKAMQYEGTKSEIVQGFKDQGNEVIKEKKWADAKEFYTKGIAILNAKQGKWDEPKPEDLEEENRKQMALREVVYVNRALCQLELRNYRSTTLDCAQALKMNPRNVKAHYRSASALLALDKVHEALDVCYRGLKIDEENVALKKLLDKIKIKSEALEARDRKRLAEQKRAEQERLTLQTALAARNIKTRGSRKPPDLQDATIRLSPDPLSPKSMLEFPAMFLYPLHNQTDLVKAWAEKDAVWQHLSYILPLPWDEKSEYKDVECYMDTITGGLMKVGKKLSLLELLSNGKTEIVDGLVRIYVVPTARAREWIEEIKALKGK